MPRGMRLILRWEKGSELATRPGRGRAGGIGGTAEIIGYLAETKRRGNVPYIKVRPAKPDKLNEELVHTYERANRPAINARDRYRRVWSMAGHPARLGNGPLFWYKDGLLHRRNMGDGPDGGGVRMCSRCLCAGSPAGWRKYHGHYLQERLKAETCRLLRTFYQAGIAVDITSEQSKEQATMLVGRSGKGQQGDR